MIKHILVFIILMVFVSCNIKDKKNQNQLTIFCASSLTDVITELIDEFEEGNNVKVKLNVASSGTLARQIEFGASADIFISANKRWVDYLESSNLIKENTIAKCAGNSLVAIAPVDLKVDTFLFDGNNSFPASFDGYLSIGDPGYVPAGAYAKQALVNMGYYDVLNLRLLPAKDVRAALMVVEMGEAERGIVYRTDAIKSTKVDIIGYIPSSMHKPILYYSVILKNHKPGLTTDFYTFIQSKRAKQVWEKYGFAL